MKFIAWIFKIFFSLLGLVFVLDVPGRLSTTTDVSAQWLTGVALAFCAASVFACALWITDHKLSQVRGSVRSLLTIFIVFSSVNLAGLTGALPGGLNLPATSTGWLALATLVVLYGTGFIVLFISVPRLDMPRNAPVMNIEPLATLLMGWIVLVAVKPLLAPSWLTALPLITARRVSPSASASRSRLSNTMPPPSPRP